MAKATEKGGDSYYILYCCSKCDQKLGSEDVMKQHMKVCKMAPDTSWIKKEPQEESAPTISSEEVAGSTHNMASSASIIPKQTTPVATSTTLSELTGGLSTQANISVSCSTKTDSSQTPFKTNCSQSVMPQPVRQHGQNMSKQLMPGRSLCQPQSSEVPLFHNAKSTPPEQGSQIRLPVQKTLSPQYHNAAKSLTASDIIRQRLQVIQSQPPAVCKKNVTPSTSPVKAILPKAPVLNDSVVTSSNCGANVVPKYKPVRNILPKEPVVSNSFVPSPNCGVESSVPVIERVYYTSKATCDPVGQIKVAKDAHHPPPLTKAFNKVHPRQEHAKNINSPLKLAVSELGPVTLSATTSSHTATVVQSQCKFAPNTTRSNIQPKQSLLQTLQASQGLQYLPQNVQQMPTSLLRTPLDLARVSRSLLPRLPPLLQNQQAVIKDNPDLIQQSLLQQNTLLFQAQQAQGNVLQNSVTQNNQAGSKPFVPLLSPQKTLLPPQKITVQASPCGANILQANSSALLTSIPPTVSLPAAMSSRAGITTSPIVAIGRSPQKQQNQILTAANKPVSFLSTSSVPAVVIKQKPVISVPLPMPAATLPQVTGSIKPLLSSRQAQPVLPSPNGSNLIWLPASAGSNVGQNFNELQSAVTTSSLPPSVAALSQTVGGITSVASLKQTHAQVIKSNGAGILWLPGSVGSNTLQNSGQLQVGATINPASSSRGLGVHADVTEKLQNFSQPKQNQQSSNIVLLPPMTPQGHILSGIRIDAPQLVSPMMSQRTNKLSGAPIGAPQPVSPVMSQSTNILSGVPIIGTLTLGRANPTTIGQLTVRKTEDASKTEETSSGGKPVSSVKKTNGGKCKNVISKSQNLDTKIRDMCGGDDSISMRGKNDKVLSPSLMLSFYVKGSVNHYSVAQMTVIIEPKVLQVAKMLFSGKLIELGPVILDDGRQIFPIDYTGPYTPKDTKTFLRANKSFVNVFEKTDTTDNSAEKMETENDITIQTVRLPGKKVWLFKDFDCPKILWQLNLNDSQVLALPLEHDLPEEAMKQVEEISKKYESSVTQGIVPLFVPQTVGTKVEAQINSQPVLPREKVESCGGMVKSSQGKGFETSLTPEAQWVSTTSCMPLKKSEPIKKKSYMTPQMDDTNIESTQSTTMSHCFESEPEGHMHSTMSELTLPEQKEASWQLTVRAAADVVQRALEAFVRLERIPLTDSLQQQLKAHFAVKKTSGEVQSLECTRSPIPVETEKAEVVSEKRGRKPEWLKKLQGEIPLPPDQTCQVKSGGLCSLSSEIREVNIVGSPEKERRGRSRLRNRNEENSQNRNEENSQSVFLDNLVNRKLESEIVFRGSEQMEVDGKDKLEGVESEKQTLQTKLTDGHDTKTWTKLELMWNSQEPINAKRKNRKRKYSSVTSVESNAERLELEKFESSVSFEKSVRRSIRIGKQPKADYRLHEELYDFIDRDEYLLNEDRMGQDLSETEQMGLSYKVNTEPKAGTSEGLHLVMGDQTLDKMRRFDVYIDTADAVGGEDDAEHFLVDDSHSQDTVADEMDEDCDSQTTEQFMKMHAGDFEKVIFKTSKKGCESEIGAKGHVLYSCKICGCYQSRSMDDFIFHLKQHYSGELACKICCNFTAACKEELIEHEALEHTGKPLYRCKICTTDFFSLGVFQSHMKRCAGFPGKVCSFNFPSEHDLQVHHKKEHPKMFICHLCSLELESEKQVQLHYSSCVDGYQCCLCYVKKATKSGLQSHMKEEHGHKSTVSFCSFEHCGACFLTTEELENHASGHV